MSQNESERTPQEPGGEKAWWDEEEYSGDYVPGSLADGAGSADTDAIAEEERARREAAAGPATQAVPVVTDADAPADAASSGTDATRVIAAPEPHGVASAEPTVIAAPAGAPRPEGDEALKRAMAGTDTVASEETLRASLASKPVFPRVLQWLVAILTPFVLLAGAVRAVASGGFLWLEYHRPGFPVDQYGFSLDQRMTYGSYGLDYVNNFAGPDYLGGLVVPSGVRTLAEPALFKATEVEHMHAVQQLIHLCYLVGAVGLVLIVISCLILRARYAGGVRRSLFAGVLATLGLAAVLGTLGALGWETFFTDFHRIFFSGGNWEFYLDDTLIRLYPPQFWVDAALVLGSLVVVVCVVVICLSWPTRARRERSKARQAQREFRLG